MTKAALAHGLFALFFCTGGFSWAAFPIPGSDPLAAIDLNRNAIIADIVRGFESQAGNEGTAKLKARLEKLRADKLLAASLASSRESLDAIVTEAETPRSAAFTQVHEKALGDPNRDLVYTPLAPCRLIDTRGNGAPFQGGAFAPGTRRAYVPAGACGIPTAGVATMLVSFTTQNLTPVSGGVLAILAPAAPFTATVDVFNLGSEWSASNTAVATGSAGQFDVFVLIANAHVIVDVLGYFAPPQGGFVTSVTAGTGLTGGTISSTGTIGIATAYQLPQTCVNGQVATSNGAGGWNCVTPVVGTGTVTSVATGTGLTGGPITGSGTISIAPGGVGTVQLADAGVTTAKLASASVATANLADGSVSAIKMASNSCTNGQVLKYNGAAWACAADNNSGGTVTSVATGSGLTGGPIATSGTVSVATGGITPTMLASDAAGLAAVTAGRMAVVGNRVNLSGSGGVVDTSTFTGLGFSYYPGFGEGAIMSSYDDGIGYLTFYTKAQSGLPITQRMIIDRVGHVGINTSSPGAFFLYVNGNAFTTGTWGASDARWKKSVQPLNDALHKVMQLRGVTYEWQQEEFPERGFDAGVQMGFLAQEAELVVPELVKTDENGFKAMSYDKVTALLVEGIKEQQVQIEALKARNVALEQSMAHLASLVSRILLR